ncbi:anhydro-N-acetylmuramic acid kinase [Aestuariirhabdus litorea]|uniref:Anhydro-N-acetylmuramic acid kinase n=2 Tax=Aestuariirhabdus litorea TaxID=2528527 RepID=A0A3P3VMI0_9GAMM|nr:anhydro-N-acetylmuramic acid kinase [Aestuariirhabdus litorea]RWW93711.1 anhydro-N-acetylmuramic acid kinase [Endozoicomonadaceae bacterium GTF-13]
MSGTSLDGVDGVLADFTSPNPLIAATSLDFPPALRSQLLQLCRSGPNEVERIAAVEPELTRLYAQVVLDLLASAALNSSAIAAIGCHGQTIRHLPEQGFSLQIGNPSLLAELTGIPVVADFRRRDLAAGGEGAPLVPAFHRAYFSSPEENRMVVNIGGMANISCLPSAGTVTGFDTGPGNILMDAWCEQHRGTAYDDRGLWAASGTVDQRLLKSLLADDYFLRSPPKSTGRERFNRDWLEQHLSHHPGLACQDVQATLLELSARSISDAIARWGVADADCFLCGGGAYNDTLLARLQALMPERTVVTTTDLGIEPRWVEGATFSWLALQHLKGMPGNLEAVTRARGGRILGGLYPA